MIILLLQCDLLNVMFSGYIQLWPPAAENRLFMTSRMLWSQDTTNLMKILRLHNSVFI